MQTIGSGLYEDIREAVRESGGAKLVHGSGGIVPPRAA